MHLGYSVWSKQQFENVLSANSTILADCAQLGIGWIALCDLYSVPSIYGGLSSHQYRNETAPELIVDVIKKLKDNGYNLMLKFHYHPIESYGLKPDWGAFWVKATDYATFFEDVKNAIVQYVPYFDKGDGRGGIDALCVATELESMAYYIAEWSHTISELKNNYPIYIPILYACHSIQPLREKYADRISWFIFIKQLLQWWFGQNPYEALYNELQNAKALGSDIYIPSAPTMPPVPATPPPPTEFRAKIVKQILDGRAKQLNKFLDIVGCNFYYQPAMETLPELMEKTYTNYPAAQLGEVNYVQCLKEYAQGKRLWVTECGLEGENKGNLDYLKSFLKPTLQSIKDAGAEVCFLWDVVHLGENFEALKYIAENYGRFWE